MLVLWNLVGNSVPKYGKMYIYIKEINVPYFSSWILLITSFPLLEDFFSHFFLILLIEAFLKLHVSFLDLGMMSIDNIMIIVKKKHLDTLNPLTKSGSNLFQR